LCVFDVQTPCFERKTQKTAPKKHTQTHKREGEIIMAVVSGNRQQVDIKQALKDLEFISAAFSWLFNLMSRIAEPFMLLSAMYIIIEAGIPAASIPALHNICVAIMISAPEVILPGAFVIASQIEDRGSKNARALFGVCYLFIGLTLLTLLSLFVWHFNTTLLSYVMFARCATGIGYSILIRILSHREKATPQPPAQVQPTPPEITPQHISLIVSQLTEQLGQIVTTNLTGNVTEQITRLVEEHLRNVPAVTAQALPVGESATRATRQIRTRSTARRPHGVLKLSEGTAEMRLAKAYAELQQESEKVTVKSLRIRAGVQNEKARAWLKEKEEGAA
jgi:hypothetical protein